MASTDGAASGRTAFATTALAATAAAGIAAGLYYYYYHVKPRQAKEAGTAVEGPKVQSLYIFPIKSCKGIEVQSAAIGPTGFLWDRWWMLVDENRRFVTQRQEPKMALIEPSIPSELLLKDAKHLPANAVMTVKAPGMAPLEVPLAPPAPEKAVEARVWEWEGQALEVGKESADWFSSYIGRPIRLVRFDTERALRPTDEKYAANRQTSFTDGYPYLVISQGSLEKLNEQLKDPLPMSRFRANILVEGCEGWDEDTWKTFLIGSETKRIFHGVKPCGRCKVTTTDQDTAIVGEEPLQTLKTFRSGEELQLPNAFKKEVIFGMNCVCDLQPTYLRKLNPVVSVGDPLTLVEKTASIAELTPA